MMQKNSSFLESGLCREKGCQFGVLQILPKKTSVDKARRLLTVLSMVFGAGCAGETKKTVLCAL